MMLTDILIRWVSFAIIGTVIYEFFIGKSSIKKTFLWIIANLVFIPIMLLGQLYLWRSYYRNKAYSTKIFIKDRDALKTSYFYTFLEFLFLFILTYCIFLEFTLWSFIFSLLYIVSNCGFLLYNLSRYDIFVKIGYLFNIIVLAYISLHIF